MKNKIFLTESEKNRILGLHKNAIINENKTFLNEADLNQIQQLLIDKKLMSPTLASGKTSVDGKLGPVTLNAIYSALTQTQGTPASSSTASTTANTATTTGTTANQPTTGTAANQPTTGTTATISTLPLSGVTAQSNLSNQQLATGPIKSGQEIRQDYRQQQRQERQGARQERQDVKQMEQELKNLQATMQRLQGKMTPQVKLGYENQIKQLQTQIGQQG